MFSKNYRLMLFMMACLLLGVVLLFSPVWAGSATIQWDAATNDKVIGYKVYVGSSESSLGDLGVLNVGNVTTYRIENLPPGQKVFVAVTAYTSVGFESVFSNVDSGDIPPLDVNLNLKDLPIIVNPIAGYKVGGVIFVPDK